MRKIICEKILMRESKSTSKTRIVSRLIRQAHRETILLIYSKLLTPTFIFEDRGLSLKLSI